MDPNHMRRDDFLLERNLKKSEKSLITNVIGVESLGDVQQSILNQSTDFTEHEHEHEVDHSFSVFGFIANPANFPPEGTLYDGHVPYELPKQVDNGDSGLDLSISVNSSHHSLMSSPVSSVALDHSMFNGTRSSADDSGIGNAELDLAAGFRNYIKTKIREYRSFRSRGSDSATNRPNLEDVLNLNEDCDLSLEDLGIDQIEHLTTYDIILKKIKQCCDLISLLANQRGSIDSFMMKLPENPKQVNFWQSIKKSPRIDALIFDVVQIGKAEQLRAARVVQSMENYCKDRNEKIVETVVVDELLESLLELEALRMQHAEVLKILHAQSKENYVADETSVCLSGLKTALQCVASHLWTLKLIMIPDPTVKPKRVSGPPAVFILKKDKENTMPK